MVIHCSKCTKPSITFIRYNGSHLCPTHFFDYVERRVKKEIKKQGKTQNNSRIGVAVSGGKDSTVALHLIHQLFSKRNQIQLYAITVDEGIKGYRDNSIPFAQQNCKNLGIEHHLISFRDVMKSTMDDIAKRPNEIGECSYCGVFRRLCLNMKAKELKLDKLVTGHNLDDMAQSVLMNFVNGDMQKLARLGPHRKIQPNLVPRMMPLRLIPEKEVMLYAILQHIPFHNAECPYAIRALRGEFRHIIDNLEWTHPGTRHSILSSYESIKDVLLDKYPPAALNRCIRCGEPTSQIECKTCILRTTLRKK